MNVMLVNGFSASGKSTLARRLRAAGEFAVSTDGVDDLARWVDRNGDRAVRPDHPDAAWLAEHSWQWDARAFDALIADAERSGTETLWLCGHAENARDLADRFDRVILLVIDRDTMLRRLSDPARGNDYGSVGDTRRLLIEIFDQWYDEAREWADDAVDATGTIDDVLADVLSRKR